MNKTTCIITTALVAAFTLTSIGTTRAEEGAKKKPDPAAKFAKLDTDKNGSLSKEEFSAKAKTPAKAEKQFTKLDANKDGALSLEEFSAKPQKKAPASGAQGGESKE